MKILQVIPSFAPKFGGTVSSVFIVSKELAKRGHSITLITSDLDFDKNYAQTLEEFGVEIIPFHTVANFGLFKYTPSLKKWLKNNIRQYNVIHLHDFRAYQNISIPNLALQNNNPYLIQAHGSVLPFFEKKLLKRLYDVVWGNKILKNASRVIALCEAEAEQYRTMGVPENKIVIIPNGLDLSQFLNLPEKGTFRSKYGISENEKIVLFLGRIHKIKGIDLLIDAYSDLLKELPNIRLVIAGPDDNYLSVIKKQIQREKLDKSPLLTGPLYGQEKLAAYIDADVFVLPSRYETFPNTLMEAWACGTPVIVTKRCLISDIVEKAGYVSAFDVKELKNTIKIVLNDEKQRMINVNAGLELIKNELNISSCLDQIEKVYKETIGGRQ
jgi:glycosyltransferase involved in cell wall biosynthesis